MCVSRAANCRGVPPAGVLGCRRKCICMLACIEAVVSLLCPLCPLSYCKNLTALPITHLVGKMCVLCWQNKPDFKRE